MTRKRALVVRGGWEGHVPVAATELFIPFLEKNGYEVHRAESPAAYADSSFMSGVDLVVQCYTMGSIEPDELRGLESAIRAGTGMAGWHGGIADSFRNSSDYLHLIGGQFACHPGRHPDEASAGTAEHNFVPYTVNLLPEAGEHPITAGIADFDLVTEQYWVLTDDYVDVLATTTQRVRPWDPWHREVTSPAVWTRRWGNGKIFVATPGHSLDVLEHDSVRTIIERGMLWAAR
ncbi:ThuA domain-containing protein [Nonomuraea sp. SBT364]|uniref:ThuA domain-containing protein n=1 Tax=Nonomuraea sp. SBT364 TaxID=1580530 RepID=UPI00066BFA13|nr:ThuA domain-containing protein [Nonomuraea sp. SBT364]